MDVLELLDVLRRAPVLRKLPLGELDRLASQSSARFFEPGTHLIEAGSEAEEVFVILEGSVTVHGGIRDQEQSLLAVRGVGELVGEMALVDGMRRSARVAAQGRVEALVIPRDSFLSALSGHAEACLDLVRTLSRRLRESDRAQIQALEDQAKQLVSSNRKLRRENRTLRSAAGVGSCLSDFIGTSTAASSVREAGARAAASDLPVMLVGETGTGKELLARGIHQASERAQQPFVALNCALFRDALLESELFGHARGAFTGAHTAKEGLVEAADRGTLFLDELADMPPATQAALLRFLELGEYRRLGETGERGANVRIIAAIAGDPEEAVVGGGLRRDLLYRLDVFRLDIPPLRERREDIVALVPPLIEEIAARLSVKPLQLTPDALDALSVRDFLGNVRELRNEIERLYATHPEGSPVEARNLSARVPSQDPSEAGGYQERVSAFKVKILGEALADAGGNRAAAARALGLHRSNLVRMIRDLDV